LAGAGTVTTASVVSANGFAGTVATATTTPAITLSTNITGPLKGNGTALQAAAASDIYNLFSGTPSSSCYLSGSGACSAPAGTGVSSLASAGGTITITGTNALNVDLAALTGDCTTTAGTLSVTCTKTSGVAFGALATLNTAGVTVGGNGLTTAALGDLRYGSGTNTLAALAGNTTATKKFLTQTGTGSVSAAPAWGTIANTDVSGLGSLSTQSGTFSGTSSGTNTGDQTITLTGDCTGSGTGSFATTCTKTSGTAFGTFATANAATPPAIGGTTPAAGAFTTLGSTLVSNLASGLTQASNTSADGLTLIDSTAATAANQQFSPRVTLGGQGWGTTAPASYPVKWFIENQPIQGTALPSSNLVFSSSINGGASTTTMVVKSGTANGVTIFGGLGVTDALFAPNYYNATGVSGLNVSTTTTAIQAASVVSINVTATTVAMPTLASSSAATTGTVCWTNSTGNLTVDTTLACLSSTRKIKQDIRPLDIGLSKVMQMEPVAYNLKPEFNPKHLGPQVGLIAEDVQKVDPRLVGLDSKGDVEGVRYMQLTAVLVKAIQEQQQEIDALKRQFKKRLH